MKLKQQPDDFVVVEDNQVAWDDQGRFAVYRLSKTGLNTLDAVAQVAKMLEVTRGRINYSGLKDRHARTEQVLTILNGPKANLKGSGWSLDYLGRAKEPVKPATLQRNRFTIILRDIRPDEVAHVKTSLARIAKTGLPNYFDDQRFGSARHGQGFFAKAAIRGDWEKAVRLAIATPAREDSARDKRFRNAVRDRWGDWQTLLAELPKSPERTLVAWLADHPKDFHGAANRIDRNLLGLMLVAYQSWIWNEAAARLFKEKCRDVEELPYSRGTFVYPVTFTKEEEAFFRDLELAMPVHRAEFASEEERRLIEDVLKREGLTLDEFKVELEKHTFRSFRRKVLLRPEGLSHGAFDKDPLNSGALFLRLNFSLPRGSFATILIKAIQRRGAEEADADEDAD